MQDRSTKDEVDRALWVGRQVWRFDADDRRRAAPGVDVFRLKWRPAWVVGETTRSWLIAEYNAESAARDAVRVSKRQWQEGPSRWTGYAISEDEIERWRLVESRHQLADAVARCCDYDTLIAIDGILSKWRNGRGMPSK